MYIYILVWSENSNIKVLLKVLENSFLENIRNVITKTGSKTVFLENSKTVFSKTIRKLSRKLWLSKGSKTTTFVVKLFRKWIVSLRKHLDWNSVGISAWADRSLENKFRKLFENSKTSKTRKQKKQFSRKLENSKTVFGPN